MKYKKTIITVGITLLVTITTVVGVMGYAYTGDNLVVYGHNDKITV